MLVDHPVADDAGTDLGHALGDARMILNRDLARMPG